MLVGQHFIQQDMKGLVFNPTLLIFAAIAFFTPLIIIKWFTSSLHDNAKKLELARENFKKTLLLDVHPDNQPHKKISTNTFQNALKKALENTDELQKLLQKKSLTLTQAIAMTNSLNDLSLKMKQKTNDLAHSARDTNTASTIDTSKLLGIANEISNIINSKTETFKDAIAALNTIKSDMSTSDQLLKSQNEIIGTKIQINTYKTAEIPANLKSMYEKFLTESRNLDASVMAITSDLLGTASFQPSGYKLDSIKKSSDISRPSDAKNPGTTKLSTKPLNSSIITKESTASGAATKRSISDKEHTKSTKVQHSAVKEKILNLQVEERKIPLRSDARFEDL